MTKKRALELVDELISGYKSDYQGTSVYKEGIKEFEKMREYITRKLNSTNA